MRFSIALCTYNGEAYLQAQLDSIAKQSRLPDEMVVCDDVSADGTVDILKHFAATAPFPVRICQNENNLGSTRNYEKAIALCSCDVIALADQDDVWLPDKLARLEQALIDHPQAGLAFSDAIVVDANLNDMGVRLSQALHETSDTGLILHLKDMFQLLARKNCVTGATMAFRAQYRSLISPISPYWVHDHWIAVLVSTQAPLIFVPEPLILYRQHENNQIGATQSRPFHQRVVRSTHIPVESYQRAYKRSRDLHQHVKQVVQLSAEDEHFLAERTAHFLVRAELPEARIPRLRVILGEVLNGRYGRYSTNGLLSAIRDMIA